MKFSSYTIHIDQILNNHEFTIKKIYEHGFKQYINHESKINALTTILNENLLEKYISEALKRRKSTLKGLPILIKDTILTKDFITTEGKKKFGSFLSTDDAVVIKNIKDAGGIILGKTNLSEGALDFQTYNDLFGVTNNPFDLKRSPGGSSGGSASAVVMNYAPFAIGSDIAGSLRVPAGFTGIYSLRPTIGKIFLTGHLELSNKGNKHCLDTIGPMAKTIDHLSLLYQVLRGDKSIKKIQPKLIEELKILISPKIKNFEVDNTISSEIMKFGKILINSGTTVAIKEQNLDFKLITETNKEFFEIYKNPNSANSLDKVRKKQVRIQNNQYDILSDFDAWILPVCSTTAIKHNFDKSPIIINGKAINYWKALGQYCIPFSISGFPVVTMPIGMINGLPVGVQVIARKNEDFKLLAIVKTIEKLFGTRIPPPKLVN